MERISLNGIWHLRGRPEGDTAAKELSLPGRVPGQTSLALSEAGILPHDLFFGNNITTTEAYEGYEWWYERTFTVRDIRPRAHLVFRGVDCLAEYFLNGERIGTSDNMFIPHEFDVSDQLHVGENTLAVHLSSPTVHTLRESADMRCVVGMWRPSAEAIGIRRAPHTYGWDIMPRVVDCGIWRDVYLEYRDEASFRQLFFTFDGKNRVNVGYEIACAPDDLHGLSLHIEGKCGDSAFTATEVLRGAAGSFSLWLNSVRLWWPHGYGEAALYDVTVTLRRGEEILHTDHRRLGLRTVTLERTDMTDGVHGTFRFLINGVEIFAKGSNWVPLDAFHSRDRERYPAALRLVADSGCNMLRCWGGNVYEDHAFFDFCDEHGVMVWQDFAMACNFYPQTEEFQKKLRREAEVLVREYRGHPSLVLWSGDNEVDQLLVQRNIRPSENVLTRRVLADVVFRNDGTRPYLPSSPYVSDALFDAYDNFADRDRALPENHLWGARDYYKSPFYKNSTAHFVSETGYHGCPAPASIRRFISPDKVFPYRNDEWILHSSDQHGNDSRVMLMEKQVRQLFGEVPEDPETYAVASQISQAEAMKYFVERVRVGRPRKTGILWWNLLDGWPQMSDAVVDYYFTEKIAYRYLKRAQAPFAVCLDELYDWNLRICACNDTLEEKCGHLRITDADSGEELFSGDFRAAKNATTVVGHLPLYYSEKRLLLLRWQIGKETGFNHYLTGFPPFDLARYICYLKNEIL